MPRGQLNYIDEDGDLASHGLYLAAAIVDPSHADYQALVDAIDGVSNARIASMSVIRDATQTDLTTSNPYDSEDKARLTFLDAVGNKTHFFLPAPLRISAASAVDVFEANDDHVDRNSTIVNDLIAAILSFAVSKGADALIAYIDGERKRRNRRS